MNNIMQMTQEQFKELLKEIYSKGQQNPNIGIEEIINEIKSKILYTLKEIQ